MLLEGEDALEYALACEANNLAFQLYRFDIRDHLKISISQARSNLYGVVCRADLTN